MRWVLVALAVLLSTAGLARAQHATAGNGYYPYTYNGDTWTGVLTSVNDDKRELTLTFEDRKHNKSETFVGVIEEGYITKTKDGQVYDLHPSLIPLGTKLTVYYMIYAKKEEGKKIKVNTIFLIDGIPNLKKGQSYFKAFQ